ncbi:MAG: YbaK/EbsC family protein [Sphingomonas sp.]|uniref:aminoacyl-tRNA deacylase n=1 Tax=Sphingomonas sp. TaxID=28214 RepID=UPI003568903C
MTIAPKLQHYLDRRGVVYEIVPHVPTATALEIARVCHIPAERLAKAVLLDTDDDYLLAVLPSDRRVDLDELGEEFGAQPHLAQERDLASVFDDCAPGAVPALGVGYGVATIVDDSLEAQPDVYFEGGDHATLIHMEQSEFARLTEQARHGRFSEPVDG